MSLKHLNLNYPLIFSIRHRELKNTDLFFGPTVDSFYVLAFTQIFFIVLPSSGISPSGAHLSGEVHPGYLAQTLPLL